MIGGFGLPTWGKCTTLKDKSGYALFCCLVVIALMALPFTNLFYKVKRLVKRHG